ncbi:MAG TPA: hypothetical protein VJJ51_04165 [Candidatus Methanoperedens sp.]|nr:hypothetical protein [Candidatus Methanoperedens sp.]
MNLQIIRTLEKTNGRLSEIPAAPCLELHPPVPLPSHPESLHPGRAVSRTCRLRAAGIQKMAELAEGDGGKELRVLSGAVYDAGWGI